MSTELLACICPLQHRPLAHDHINREFVWACLAMSLAMESTSAAENIKSPERCMSTCPRANLLESGSPVAQEWLRARCSEQLPGTSWPTSTRLGRLWSSLARLRPISAQLGQSCRRLWPNSDQVRPESVGPRPQNPSTLFANLGQNWLTFVQHLAIFADHIIDACRLEHKRRSNFGPRERLLSDAQATFQQQISPGSHHTYGDPNFGCLFLGLVDILSLPRPVLLGIRAESANSGPALAEIAP